MKMILYTVAHAIFCAIQEGVKEPARDAPYMCFREVCTRKD